jgi:hypothetical protein
MHVFDPHSHRTVRKGLGSGQKTMIHLGATGASWLPMEVDEDKYGVSAEQFPEMKH